MAARTKQIEVVFGGSPLVAAELLRGLTRFGKAHPNWRIAARSRQFDYSPGWLRRNEVAGMLLWQAGEDVLATLQGTKVPYVELLPHQPRRHPVVGIDHVAVGRLAAQTFLDLGFKRFGFCGISTRWSAERGTAFADAVMAAGHDAPRTVDIRYDLARHWPPESEAGQTDRLSRWLQSLEHPVAVLAAHDAPAAMVAEMAEACGYLVPDDIAVLGVGDLPAICDLSPVGISSIDTGADVMAHQACEVLDATIRGESVGTAPVLLPPRGVHVRRSTQALSYDDPLVREAVAYIREHSCEPLCVGDVCREFNVSNRTLNRRFNPAVGHSPGSEIRRARLHHAHEMLIGTSLPLVEIALRCGFADQAHFSRLYHKTFGQSPSSARRAHAGR